MVVGSRLEPGSMGRNTALERYPHLAEALTEPGTVVFDESDKEKLGVTKVGDVAEVAGARVRVVGFVARCCAAFRARSPTPWAR